MAVPDNPEVVERFETHLDLVEIIARQVARSCGQGIDFEDLMSAGREGLFDAARRFDESRGVPFRAYANYRVRGAIIDGVRSMSRLPRRVYQRVGALEAALRVSEGALEDLQAPQPPGAALADAEQALADHLGAMATALAVGLLAEAARGEDGEVAAVARDETPEEALGRAQLFDLMRQAIDELPEQEAELVRRHYLGGERFDHVAADLGLSKSWASRLHTRAVTRLSKRLRGATD